MQLKGSHRIGSAKALPVQASAKNGKSCLWDMINLAHIVYVTITYAMRFAHLFICIANFLI